MCVTFDTLLLINGESGQTPGWCAGAWHSGLLSCNSSHDCDQSSAQSLTRRQPFVNLLFTTDLFFVSSLFNCNFLSHLLFSGKQEIVRTIQPTLCHTSTKHVPRHEHPWHEFLTALSNCLWSSPALPINFVSVSQIKCFYPWTSKDHFLQRES